MASISLRIDLGEDKRFGPGKARLLELIRDTGSISAAARALGLSYRHVWGELKRWEGELGQELVIWVKGQAALLSPFGEKLLWAERRAQARLAPQIEALRGELERAFAVAFDPAAHVLTLFASHDNALAELREHALALGPAQQDRHDDHGSLHLDIRFCGSLDAIRALNEGRCAMAGFHTLQTPAPGSLAERSYKPLLRPGQHKIIGFARRAQGLITAPGNPLQLRSVQDLARTRARFVNRSLGTGTRLLLAELLHQAGLDGADIQGFTRTEPSHAAVAHAVADGSADAGLGIESAARALELGFTPLVQEHYYLVCLKSALEHPATQALLATLADPAWQQRLAQMPGYAPQQCGQVLSLRQVLPWWRFRNERRPVEAGARAPHRGRQRS